MADMQEESTGSAVNARGAGYPVFSLEEALLRARKFWEAERKNAAPVPAAVAHWGYGPKSSGGKRTIAALIQYGLMSDEGSEENRKVRLTDLALSALLSPPDSEVWVKAVRQAAMSPRIYADLLNRWPAHELPSDASLQFYLVKDRNFNPSKVSDFLQDFRATVAFAKLGEAPASQPQVEGQGTAREDDDTVHATAVVGSPQNALPASIAAALRPRTVLVPASADVKQDVFTLDEGQVVLQWPAKMSAASYQDLKDWIELQMRKIGRAVE